MTQIIEAPAEPEEERHDEHETLDGIEEDRDLFGQFRKALGPSVETSAIETDIDLAL